MTDKFQPLPPLVDLTRVPILQALNAASRMLAELKGLATAIPNESILIDTLFLQEARASSEVENILTTQDEIFREGLFPDNSPSDGRSVAAKEVMRYRDALQLGYRLMLKTGGFIHKGHLIEMYQLLKLQKDGFRKKSVVLKNDRTGEIIYRPPQNSNHIVKMMEELEGFINQDEVCDLDPLIKMALIHHRFESIHPFSDGNGRIGRILNVLYLTRAGLLQTPILYLSRHIIQTKAAIAI